MSKKDRNQVAALCFGLVCFANGIAAPPNRSQVLGFSGVLFDFDSQVLYVGANQLGASRAGRILPELPQELLGGKDLTGSGHQIVKKFKFSRRKQDHSVADP